MAALKQASRQVNLHVIDSVNKVEQTTAKMISITICILTEGGKKKDISS